MFWLMHLSFWQGLGLARCWKQGPAHGQTTAPDLAEAGVVARAHEHAADDVGAGHALRALDHHESLLLLGIRVRVRAVLNRQRRRQQAYSCKKNDLSATERYMLSLVGLCLNKLRTERGRNKQWM